MEAKIGEIIELLKSEINKQNKESKYEFNPKEFWRNQKFKELENIVQETFGFRSVIINPYIEKYNDKNKTFESAEINCYTYLNDRYPIDGLITDNGFYDKTHSINMYIVLSLGILTMLNAKQMVAVFLHEFGHGIDPALVTINYVEANIISKYLSNRKKDISDKEKNAMKKRTKRFVDIPGSIFLTCIVDFFRNLFKGKDRKERGFEGRKLGFGGWGGGSSKPPVFNGREKRLEKLRNIIRNDKSNFTTVDNQEAYADNFARMYGYGPQLAEGLKLMDQRIYRQSLKLKEKKRESVLFEIAYSAINNVHKTDIHRARNLIKEYEADLKDPNIPEAYKKAIREDKESVEKVLEAYTKDFGELQNNINKVIIEELDKMDGK